jgi:hypothetical protein
MTRGSRTLTSRSPVCGELGQGRTKYVGRCLTGHWPLSLVWAGTCDVGLAAWWPGGAGRLIRWRGEAEVLVTILPASQELHDVTLIVGSAQGPASPV